MGDHVRRKLFQEFLSSCWEKVLGGKCDQQPTSLEFSSMRDQPCTCPMRGSAQSISVTVSEVAPVGSTNPTPKIKPEKGRRKVVLSGWHKLPLGTRGSAAAASIYRRCPAGRAQERRPDGTGIAGSLLRLPKPSELHFLPSAAKGDHDPTRSRITTCLHWWSLGPKQSRGQGNTSKAKGQRGKISVMNRKS